MRVARWQPGWRQVRVWYKEVDVTSMVMEADDVEGWVRVQVPPVPQLMTYTGLVRIEVQEEGNADVQD